MRKGRTVKVYFLFLVFSYVSVSYRGYDGFIAMAALDGFGTLIERMTEWENNSVLQRLADSVGKTFPFRNNLSTSYYIVTL